MSKNRSGSPDKVGLAILLMVVSSLFVGCGGEKAGGGFSMPPTPVEIATVKQGQVVERFETVGTVDADNAITVVAEIAGTIVELPFDEGTRVAEGSLIARLDDAQLQAEVDRSEARREQAQARYNRVRTVVEEGAGAPQDLDDAAANLKVAEADLALAQARLAKTRITAPFDGIIGSRRVSRGAFLHAGEAITELAQTKRIRVRFATPERYLEKLTRGSSVRVSTISRPDVQLEGTIDVIEPVLDPTTRSARVLARVENPGGHLLPGMSANVAAVLQTRPDALTIPSEAVFVEGDQAFVYLVRADSTVVRRALSLGSRLPGSVEVAEGLSVGERVVRAGHQKIFEGARIRPIESGAAPSSGEPQQSEGDGR